MGYIKITLAVVFLLRFMLLLFKKGNIARSCF